MWVESLFPHWYLIPVILFILIIFFVDLSHYQHLKKCFFVGFFFICLLFFLMYLLSLFCYVLVTMFREVLYKALLLSLLLLLLLILSVSFFSLSCSKIFRLFNFQVSATTVQPQGASERVVF